MVRSEQGFLTLSLPEAIMHLPRVGWAAHRGGRLTSTFLSLIAEPHPKPEGESVLNETGNLGASCIFFLPALALLCRMCLYRGLIVFVFPILELCL